MISKIEELTNKLKDIPNEVIDDILNAKQWETTKKEDFVEWACNSITYLSSQASFNKDAQKNLQIVKLQYELYLNVINA